LLGLGTDGGIDFDAVRVTEEAKQTCTLKNKGKYDITYSWVYLTNSSALDRINVYNIIIAFNTRGDDKLRVSFHCL